MIFDPFSMPEDDRTPFAKVQENIDRSKWVGRGPNYTLEGGCNDPKGKVNPSEVGEDKNRR